MKKVLGFLILLIVVFLLIRPFVFKTYSVNDFLNQERAANPLLQIENGCLIYALEFKMTLEASERLKPYLWARTLAIRFVNGYGHAVTVFVYKNITFIYDPNVGSYIATMYPLYDPNQLAEIAFPSIPIKGAVFIEPTITLTYPYRTLAFP